MTILSRLLGLVRDTVIAARFGAGSESDAFFAAFRIPNMLRRFVADGAAGSATVPILVSAQAASRGERAFAALVVAALAFTIPLALPITELICEHGSFTATEETARALRAFAWGVCPISVQGILARSMLAGGRPGLASAIVILSLILQIGLAFLLVGPSVREVNSSFGAFIASMQEHLALAELGHVGLALSSSVSAAVSAALLLSQVRRVDVHLHWPTLFGALMKSAAAALVMLILLAVLLALPFGGGSLVVTGVSLGSISYFSTAYLLGHTCSHALWTEARARAPEIFRRVRR